LQNGSLRKLDISSNSLRDTGALTLAKSLASNRWLTELDVRNNELTDLGKQALQEAAIYETTGHR
jgi:hypothetical protein